MTEQYRVRYVFPPGSGDEGLVGVERDAGAGPKSWAIDKRNELQTAGATAWLERDWSIDRSPITVLGHECKWSTYQGFPVWTWGYEADMRRSQEEGIRIEALHPEGGYRAQWTYFNRGGVACFLTVCVPDGSTPERAAAELEDLAVGVAHMLTWWRKGGP